MNKKKLISFNKYLAWLPAVDNLSTFFKYLVVFFAVIFYTLLVEWA